jgi:hypothetical protein
MDPRSPRRVMYPPPSAGTLAAMNPQSPSPAARRQGTDPGLRPPRLRRARAAAIAVVAAAAALLATACGGSPSPSASGSPNAGGSATSPSLVNYARCMRSHGVPNFPDPTSGGQLPGGKATLIRLSQTSSRYHAAGQACQRLWPHQAPAQAQEGQQLASDLRFAQCMRSHGVPNFPDPTSGPDGLVFVLSASRLGMDPHSPQLLAKAHQCQHVLPAGSSLPHASEAP